MITIDLTTVLMNISNSLHPVQKLVTGLAYVLGILLFITGLTKLKKIADAESNSAQHDPITVPIVCFMVGAGLLYFPTFAQVITNTVFGSNNILQYTSFNTLTFYDVMVALIQTSGLVWFVRGCMLLVDASEPGKQQGLKGMVYLTAGILSMNYYATVGALDYTVSLVVTSAVKAKTAAGY